MSTVDSLQYEQRLSMLTHTRMTSAHEYVPVALCSRPRRRATFALRLQLILHAL
jgi:hypothetical protein